MRTTPRARHRWLVAVAAMALASGSACASSGDDDVDAATSTTDADAAAPADDPVSADDDPEAAPAAAEEDDPGALLLIMDASGSMNDLDDDGRPLIDGAKQALHDVVAARPDGQHVGLRVYGHRVPNSDRENGCRDTELIHPVAPLDREALDAAIDSFVATGFTPIGLALQEAAADLPADGPRTIVLVSDGEDTCAPPDACDVAAELSDGGIEVLINTVGFSLGDNEQARAELQCIADAGGGEFVDVDGAADLADAIDEASTRDRRDADLAGAVLEGAPLPRDAATGQVDTPYSDTVLGTEINYYRFEVPAGSEVQGELVMAVASAEDCGRFGSVDLELVDASGDRIARTSQGLPKGAETIVDQTGFDTADTDEVWLKIDTTGCELDTVEYEVEILVTVG